MLLVDVDRLDDLSVVSPWLNVDGPGVIQVRTRDYLCNAQENLREGVVAVVTNAGHPPPSGPIALLTQPRNLGVSFNPVSFFFCYDASGESVQTVVAEINNTPWNERFTYVLADLETSVGERSEELSFKFPKTFHVSPFNDMDVDYRWTFELGERIHVRMVLERGGEEIFRAGLHLKCQRLDRPAITHAVKRYPAQNLMTLARIYRQAFLLWRKRTPFYEHPDNRENSDEKRDLPSPA